MKLKAINAMTNDELDMLVRLLSKIQTWNYCAEELPSRTEYWYTEQGHKYRYCYLTEAGEQLLIDLRKQSRFDRIWLAERQHLADFTQRNVEICLRSE